MAASLSVQPEELRCPMCLQLYVYSHYPKQLDCKHTCCQDCLLHIVSNGAQNIACPECRHVTNVPPNGVESMSTNALVRSFAEERFEQELQDTGNGMCTMHEGEQLRFFCETCDNLICPLCLIDKHRKYEHDVKSLGDKRKECRIQMKHAIYEAEIECENCEKNETELLKAELQLDTAIMLQESRIDSRVESIVAEIRQKGQDLKSELRRLEKPRFERIHRERNHLSERLRNLKLAVTAAKSKVDSTADHAYMMQHDNLLGRITPLLVDNKPVTISRNTSVITFEPEISEIDVILGKLEKPKISAKKPTKRGGRPTPPPRHNMMRRRNSTGSVQGLTITRTNSPQRNRYCTLRQVKSGGLARRCRTLETDGEFGRFQSATCISVSDSGSVAVTDQNAKQVQIHTLENNGQYTQSMNLQLMNENKHKPQMVAFAKDKVLVARWTCVEIYLSSTGEYESSFNTRQIQRRRFRAPRVGEHDSGVVSVTVTGKRILAGNVERSTITIHDLSGSAVMKTLNVNIKPWHLATNGKHVAFSQWSANNVSVFDLDSGLELYSIVVQGPRGLIFDDTTGSILITRDDANVIAGNRTIDQYCSSTGQWIGQAVVGLHVPHDAAFTQDGALLVADYKSVKICNENETYV